MLLIIASLLVGYFAISYSPIKSAIGRRSPGAASLFTPLLFNFSHTYTEGTVLDFRVGMSREELFTMLGDRYTSRADLTINCAVTTADSVVPITPGLDIAATYGGGRRLCVRLDSRRLAADFQFQDDVVSTIEITFVRTESI